MPSRRRGASAKPWPHEEITMHVTLQRVLMAYRPLYLNGLLRDGQYQLPKADPDRPAPSAGTTRTRQRTLLAALTHTVPHHRSKP
jgi:hypothetical protein